MAIPACDSRLLNASVFIKQLIKDMNSIDISISSVVRSPDFYAQVLQPVFVDRGCQLKSTEALSIFNTLLEEVSDRRKKQSGLYNASEMDEFAQPSDDFIESQSFIDLYSRVVSRVSLIL